LASATLTSLGVFTLPDLNAARTGLAFDITNVTSRYFVINVRNLHSATTPNGNDHGSFGEIAFEAVPEPSAVLLGGLGLLALLRRRRS
jgi:PEP-CTERM motif